MPMPRRTVLKPCAVCGESFETVPSRIDERRTCRKPECVAQSRKGALNSFYGRNHSDESREKVSARKRGEWFEVECACGCGQRVSLPIYRRKLNKTGKFFANNAHLRTWLNGANHWNFRGGKYPYGPGWARIARTVRERDKVCRLCGKMPEENGRGLDVHHLNPARMSEDNSLENLVALCIKCHRKVTKLEMIELVFYAPKPRTCSECGAMFTPTQHNVRVCGEACKCARQCKWERASRERAREENRPSHTRRLAARKRRHQEKKEKAKGSQHQTPCASAPLLNSSSSVAPNS